MDVPFNECEVGLFDDWEPAVWSEVVTKSEEGEEQYEAEATVNEVNTSNPESTGFLLETRVPHNHESEHPRPHVAEGVFGCDKGVLCDEAFAKLKNDPTPAAEHRQLYEKYSSGNIATRAFTKSKRGHDKFLERMSDSMDELQDVGEMTHGGFGGNSNHTNGLGCPQLSSNLHWEYKGWTPGQPLPTPQNKIPSNRQDAKDSDNSNKLDPELDIISLP